MKTLFLCLFGLALMAPQTAPTGCQSIPIDASFTARDARSGLSAGVGYNTERGASFIGRYDRGYSK